MSAILWRRYGLMRHLAAITDFVQVAYTWLTTQGSVSMDNDEDFAPEELHFVGFNQDATSIAIGGSPGYALYATVPVEKLKLIYENHGQFADNKKKSSQFSNVVIMERFFSSALMMFVTTQAPRKLRIYHFEKNNDISSQSYPNTILAVKLNRDIVVICLETIMYIHTAKDMKVIHTIQDTPPNANGVMDLSPTVNSYLAYPGSVTYGHVHIFDAKILSAVNTISAHTNPIAALRFSYDGKKLATASTRGTVIRVFDSETGDRLFEFTRGIKRYANIYHMSFSIDGNYLCTSSNTETVHVFKLEKSAENQARNEEEQQGWMDYLSKQASSYLPTQMNDLLMREKSFATARLPSIGKRNVVALSVVDNKLLLYVANTDGYVYIYPVEAEGGELTLFRQHKIGVKSTRIVHAHDTTKREKKRSEGRNESGRGGEQTNAAPNVDDFPPLTHSTE